MTQFGTPTVFYAWQGDTNPKMNHYLIRDAAKDALKGLSKDVLFEESPRLDSDTKDVVGHPELARTIFGKIDEAAVFLADMTLTGKVQTDDGRSKIVSNANVLFELGHASARMGWDRMVLVMNKKFGDPEKQIADILHRRHATTYFLESDDIRAVKDVQAKLAKTLNEIFKSVFASRHDRVASLIRRMNLQSYDVLTAFGKVDFFSDPNKGVTTVGGPLDSTNFNLAIDRLLNLELIHADFDPRQRLYAYHWTYWGRETARELGFRP